MNKTIKLIAFISTLMVVGCAETPNSLNSIPSEVPQSSTITNTNAAVLTVKSDMTININEKLHYLNLASASDEVDGNISHLITVELPNGVSMNEGYLSFEQTGTFTITFKVVNSRNITTTNSITITVIELLSKDNHKPTILGYKASVQVKPNVMVYPLNDVTAVDDVDGDVTSSLKATYQTLGDATEGISFAEEGNYVIKITAYDFSNNEASVDVNIIVSNEDVATYVDITKNVTKEYNCSIEETDDMPYANSNTRMVVLIPDSTGANAKYANFKIQLDNNTDLKNKKIEFDVKFGENIYKNTFAIGLMNDGEKLTSQVQITSDEKVESGYSLKAIENGWFHFTIIFSKLWTIESYITDYIRVAFSNVDYYKSAYLYVANVRFDDYLGGDIDDGGNPGQTPGEGEENEGGSGSGPSEEVDTYDYSDNLENSYYATLTTDTSVSHDGAQSTKFEGTGIKDATDGADNAGAQVRIQKSLAGKKFTFYIKYDGETVRKNRVALTFYKDSSTKFASDALRVSLQDTLPSGITLTSPDSNGWQYCEIDIDAIGYNTADIYKVRFVIQTPNVQEIVPTCWIDEIKIKG